MIHSKSHPLTEIERRDVEAFQELTEAQAIDFADRLGSTYRNPGEFQIILEAALALENSRRNRPRLATHLSNQIQNLETQNNNA